MKCQSCGKEKGALRIVPSKVMSGSKWNLCDDCKEKGLEPRWALILVGRSLGIDYIKPYIAKRKYVGEEILLRDIVS